MINKQTTPPRDSAGSVSQNGSAAQIQSLPTDKCTPRVGADRPLKYAISLNRKNKNHRHWSNETHAGWHELVADLRSLTQRDNLQHDKYAAGGVLYGWLRPGPARTECPETPCSKRHKTADTVAFRSVIVLDFDAHDPGMPERVAKLGYDAVVHWTASSEVDDQRWRIWIRTDRDMLPDEYATAAFWVQEQIGQEGFDPDSHGPVRTMYRPASAVPGDFRFEVVEGRPLDVDDALFRADIESVEPHAVQRAVERPEVDLTQPPTPEQCAAAERLFQRFLQGIEESYLPGDGPGNCHNTFLGTDPDSVSFRLSGALMFRFAAGGCLDWSDVERRIYEAAESAGWDTPSTDDRVMGAMAIGKAEPSRPFAGEERLLPEDVFKDESAEPEPRPVLEPSGEDAAVALAAAEATFRKWLGAEYDLGSLHAVLATAAVERMTGDPLWLLLISGSGNAKTETVQALSGAGAFVESTITGEGALLSATPKRDKARKATGGLLMRIGTRGVLVIKDFTSILSMSRDPRGQVLGAFREIYDGRWTRNVGTDGGATLVWDGRIALVGAVTTAWDTHHSVVATMGDRFVVVRTDSDADASRTAASRQALANIGHEEQMRTELADAARRAIAAAATDGPTLRRDELDRLIDVSMLVTRARTAVDSDFRGDPITAHATEAPTRLAKQLGQMVRGGVAIGMSREAALRLAVRCARDSVPPVRMRLIDDLAAFAKTEDGEIGMASPVGDVRRRTGLPRNTVDRALASLQLLGVVECVEMEYEYGEGTRTRWTYRLAERIDPEVLA